VSWPPPNYNPHIGTGYQVTFGDFCRLVSDPYCQPSIGLLLRSWFGCEIEGEKKSALVRSADGKILNLADLHKSIQSDPQKQYYLYQEAMTLWR
jgi:hypothetical protein